MSPSSQPLIGMKTLRYILSRALKEDTTTSDGPSISELPDVKDVLEDVMVSCLQDVVARFQSYYSKCKMLKEKKRFDSDRVKKRLLRTESYLMDKFRQKEDMIIYTKDPSKHRHIMAWRKCHPVITRDLCSLNVVMDHLYQDDVLSEADMRSIAGKETPRAQTEEFFRCVEGRTEDEFHRSIVPAIKSENKHLGEQILKAFDEVDERPEDFKCTVCLMYSIVQVKKLATQLFQSDAISSVLHADLRSSSLSNRQKWKELKDARISHMQIIQALKLKYPDLYWALRRANKNTLDCFCGEECGDGSGVSGIFSNGPASASNDSLATNNSGDIANVEELEDVETIDAEILEYPMTARPRGCCVIVNNKLDHRFELASINVAKIEEVLKKLEFKIIKYEKLTSDKLYEHLRIIAKKRDHSHYNAFICYLFCKCKDDQVLGIDGGSVPLVELTSLFGATSCPSLAGKPKLFFIESSKGNNFMNVPCSQKTTTRKPSELPKNDSNVVPDTADFCIAYATASGCKCFTSPQVGYMFSHNVTDILDRQADRHDLMTCLSMINEKFKNSKSCMQVPTLVSTLTRRVNLTSNPRWSTPLSSQLSSFPDSEEERPRKKRKTDHVYGKK